MSSARTEHLVSYRPTEEDIHWAKQEAEKFTRISASFVEGMGYDRFDSAWKGCLAEIVVADHLGLLGQALRRRGLNRDGMHLRLDDGRWVRVAANNHTVDRAWLYLNKGDKDFALNADVAILVCPKRTNIFAGRLYLAGWIDAAGFEELKRPVDFGHGPRGVAMGVHSSALWPMEDLLTEP